VADRHAIVPHGKFEGSRVSDLPSSDLRHLLLEFGRHRLAHAIHAELRRRAPVVPVVQRRRRAWH